MDIRHLPPDLADYATQVAASAGLTLDSLARETDGEDTEAALRALRAGLACAPQGGGPR